MFLLMTYSPPLDSVDKWIRSVLWPNNQPSIKIKKKPHSNTGTVQQSQVQQVYKAAVPSCPQGMI